MRDINLPSIAYRTESGALVVRDGFVATFFMPFSHRTVVDAVVSAMTGYLRLPEMPQQFAVIDETGDPVMHDRAALERIFDGIRQEDGADLCVRESSLDASAFAIRYYGLNLDARRQEGWANAVSGLAFSFPTTYLGATGLVQLATFADDIANVLPFSFGYLSPAFLFLEGVGEPAAFPVIRGLAKRFLGFDVPALLPDCFEVGDGPKGAYWGNYLSAEMVRELGGEAAINRALGHLDVRILSSDRGHASLFLEPVPSSGDVNRREQNEPYRRAFALLSPLLRPRSVSYMAFDDEMRRWLYRWSDEREE